MLTSKERSRLLALSNSVQTTVYVGKFGLTDGVIKQIDEMLENQELIKIGVQKNADFTAKDAISVLCEELNAEPVHAIGSKVIIYRYSHKDGVEHIDYKSDPKKKKEEEKRKESTVKSEKRVALPRFEGGLTTKNGKKITRGKKENAKPVDLTKKTSDYKKKGLATSPVKKDGITIYGKKGKKKTGK